MEFLTLVPSSPVFSTDAYRSRRRRRLIHHPARVYACKLPSGPDEDTQPTSSVRRPLAPPLPPLLEDLVPIPNTNLQTPKNRYNVISRNPLASHLWLSSKLSPPPPPDEKDDIFHSPSPALSPKLTPTLTPDPTPPPETDFRQKGKIFVGNLPLWMKKNEIAEYFRQLGPVKSVVLIKGHHDPRRNVGYCFVVNGGPTAEESAEKAVEFDGVEFHGRVLTVRLDDGRRLKTRSNERERWVAGDDRTEHRSKWHEEREVACRKFRRVLDTHPDNWQAVVSAFDKITKPTRREFGLMINFYSRRGDKHHARATFESMRARGIEPNSYVYTNLIHAYRVARDMRGALSCVEEMKEENIEMTVVTYSILIAGFASNGDVESADSFFEEAKQKSIPLNAIIYSSIIYAHCQTGNMDRAEDLVREMEEQGIDAPIDIYHTMMDGYTNVLNERKCMIVFQRLKECGLTPSIITYGCLINFYTKIGNLSKALEVSQTMGSYGIQHNRKTFSMLINGFIQLKDYTNAFSIFEDMLKSGIRPDAVLYNIIVNAFCKMGNMDRALRIVEEMQRERYRPSSRTFRPIIYGFAEAGEIKKSLEIFDMMRRIGCIPTVETYNVLILGLARKQQMEKAIKVINEMSLAGINPSKHTYTTIMEGFASVGNIGKAFEFFTKIKEDGLKLDVFTYESLLKACCKSGRMQSALAVTREMSIQKIPKNSFVYNILIDGWARRGDVWEAADLMQQMKQDGIHPDIHTYTSFVNACCKAGDMLRATSTVEEMITVGIKPNVRTYTTLMRGWARASLPEKALKCFESFDFPTDSILPNMVMWSNIKTKTANGITSWKNEKDPSPGNFTLSIDPVVNYQQIVTNDSKPYVRSQVWTGNSFDAYILNNSVNPFFTTYEVDDQWANFTFQATDATSYYVLNYTGTLESFEWNLGSNQWMLTSASPVETCDLYGLCGPFGICDYNAAPPSICRCFKGFEPKIPEDWGRNNFQGGCARKKPLSCNSSDGFLEKKRMKLPDHVILYRNFTNINNCRTICLVNCSCTAYSFTSNTSDKNLRFNACLLWIDELRDLAMASSGGAVLYVRLATPESGGMKKVVIILITISSLVVAIACIGLLYKFVKLRRRKRNERWFKERLHRFEVPSSSEDVQIEESDLPMFNYNVVLTATNNFSDSNKIGQGGFGKVYMGKVPNGSVYAIKRLSRNSGQGLEEFRNEVTLIAKLQHRNLVGLVGFCVKGEERILIYEYMPNNSLGSFIFDDRKRALLDWTMRFDIIKGIARGLIYLHQDSRLRVIHRDLKASNILLDKDWNPRISDFGMARIFGGDQKQANTNRVVGT